MTESEKGMVAYSVGTWTEIDISAKVCVHAAATARAKMMLAKPGMSVGEGITIVRNEQSRLLVTMRYKQVEGETI